MGITGTALALITGGWHILRAVNEVAYHVDRMFTHLRSASGDQLHKLEALVLGDFDRALQDVVKNGTSILSFLHAPALLASVKGSYNWLEVEGFDLHIESTLLEKTVVVNYLNIHSMQVVLVYFL